MVYIDDREDNTSQDIYIPLTRNIPLTWREELLYSLDLGGYPDAELDTSLFLGPADGFGLNVDSNRLCPKSNASRVVD
jgi:hypothetical protein